MTELFRSALNKTANYLGGIYHSQQESHPLVGQTIEVHSEKYKIKSLIAEGGFALVFEVQNQNGTLFALKRQLAADRQTAEGIVREIRFLQQLTGHPNIVGYKDSSKRSLKQSTGQNCVEFLLITEFCSGGPLIDVMRRQPLTVEQVAKVINAVTQAVLHMHDRNPPITHRDLKIENLLLDSNGFIKLCDFGSATTDIFRPDDSWNALMRAQLEEDMAKFTTPMYRAPEILDTYQNCAIGPAQDIWALGCVLFYLCYNQHPFEDSAKLRIINANYALPQDSSFSIFHPIITSTLQPNPYSRPTIQDLSEQVADLNLALNIDLYVPVVSPASQSQSITASPTPNISSNNQSSLATNSLLLANQLKDQGISLLRNFQQRPIASSEQSAVNANGVKIRDGGSNASSSLTNHSSSPSSQPIAYMADEIAVGESQNHPNRSKPPPRPPLPKTLQKPPFSVVSHCQQPQRDPEEEQFLNHSIRPKQPSKTDCELLSGTFVEHLPMDNKQAKSEEIKTAEDFFRTLDWIPEAPEHSLSNKYETDTVVQTPGLPERSSSSPSKCHENQQQTLPRIPTPDYPTDTIIPIDCEGASKNAHNREKSNNAFDVINLADEYPSPSRNHCNKNSDLLDELVAELESLAADTELRTDGNDMPTNSKLVNLMDDDWIFGRDKSVASVDAALMHRNASVPNFSTDHSTTRKQTHLTTDSFSQFLSDFDKSSSKNDVSDEKQPNYSRSFFEEPTQSQTKRPTNAMFDDLLMSHNFVSSHKLANRSLADLSRASEIRELSPLEIKIKDWTRGKERNIRALLVSLGDVVWADIESTWIPPTMAELLSDSQIKRHYRKACLVVHPDKQVGTENEALAKAIFTELNDAWNDFEANSNSDR